jgi:hypothetical protein
MSLPRPASYLVHALEGLLVGSSLSGCSEPGRVKSEGDAARPHVNQIELQERVERFAGILMERMAQALEPLTAAPVMSESTTVPKRVRYLARRQVALYYTALVDIATGRFPETNLLDALVFVSLCRRTVEDYWAPEVFGDPGYRLAEAFANSQRDLEQLMADLVGPTQVAEVQRLVEDWWEDNPGQRRVELVRIFAVSQTVGKLATEREKERRKGVLSAVTTAIDAADQALLLSERLIFLGTRMPFVVRWQTRVAADELIDEGLASLGQVDATLEHAKVLGPLIADVSTLVASSNVALGDVRELVDSIRPLLEKEKEGEEDLRIERLVAKTKHLTEASHALVKDLDGVERTLSSAERVTDKSMSLVEGTRALIPEGDAASERIDALVRHGISYFAVVSGLLISLFWGGYTVAMRVRDRGPGGGRGEPRTRGRAPMAAG